MKLVLDASVCIKWLLGDSEREADTTTATSIMQAVGAGDVELLQPVHWLAEVSAVLARLCPDQAEEHIHMLYELQLPVYDDADVMSRACQMSMQYNHHLFDTLYHAVALESGATLITADDAYWRKSRSLGAITRLSQWES